MINFGLLLIFIGGFCIGFSIAWTLAHIGLLT